jgi:hypothetical protein
MDPTVKRNLLGAAFNTLVAMGKEPIGKKSKNWSIEWQQKELDKLKRAKDQKAQDH